MNQRLCQAERSQPSLLHGFELTGSSVIEDCTHGLDHVGILFQEGLKGALARCI